MAPSRSVSRIARNVRGDRVLIITLRACFGTIILVLSLWALAWNEGTVVTKHQVLDEGKRKTVSIKPNRMNTIDPQQEGSLVHLTGDAVAIQSAQDNELGVKPLQALRLVRNVEIYQWIEDVTSPVNKKDTEGSAFTYKKGWQTMLHQSDHFQIREGHENPTDMLFRSEEFVATPIQLGPFLLSESDAIVEKLSWFEDMVDGVNIDQIPDETIRNRMQPYGSSGLYYGSDPSYPQIGDLRITYQVVPSPQTISIIAAQIGKTLMPFQTSRSNHSILLVERGKLSALDMYDIAHTTAFLHAWSLRLMGTTAAYIAMLLLVQPLKVAGGFVPLIRDTMGSATLCDLLAITLMIELVVFAIIWLLYQPLLALTILAIVAGYFRNRIHESRNAPLADGYVVGNTEEKEIGDDVEMITVSEE